MKINKHLERKVLVHGVMLYKCETCGHIEEMYLEEGIEGETKEMPCPFIIQCPRCAGNMSHSMWSLDNYFEPRAIKDYESYFTKDYEKGYGIPIFKNNSTTGGNKMFNPYKEILKSQLEEIERNNQEERKVREENPLAIYSTTQLKKELRRRKGKNK